MGIRVPQWALLDVTVRCYLTSQECTNGKCQLQNEWNSNKSMTVGGRNPLSTCSLATSHICVLDSPEIGPGQFIDSQVSSTTSPTGTFPQSSDSTGFPTVTSSSASSIGGHNSNTGAIVGGVTGGIVGCVAVIAIATFWFYLRQQHTKAATTTLVVDDPSPPHIEARSQLTTVDDGIHTEPSTPDIQEPMTPMRIYVCIFIPSLYSCVVM